MVKNFQRNIFQNATHDCSHSSVQAGKDGLRYSKFPVFKMEHQYDVSYTHNLQRIYPEDGTKCKALT